jgi:mono/diheme cytochrome c family protein
VVVHNSLSILTDADLRAMATYLTTLPAGSSLAGGRKTETVPAQAAVLYVDHCAACHQAKGRGIPGVFPPLAGNGVVLAPDPANILKVVLGGVAARGGYIPMPAFGGQLTDLQVADIANYVRSKWGNAAPTNVTPQAVGALRRGLADAAARP